MNIVLEGHSYELTFNMGFLRTLFKEYGFDLVKGVEIDAGNYSDYVSGIVYSAIKTGDKNAPITKEQVLAYVDTLSPARGSKIVMEATKWMTVDDEEIVGEATAPTEPFHA
ncbi:MAG TPA: hypothetical protein VF622_14580 [Segetibacter sp.]|jgi:hypothetical protein